MPRVALTGCLTSIVMSDARFKRLFAGTENLPIVVKPENSLSIPDTVPKFDRVLENAVNLYKEDLGSLLENDPTRYRNEQSPEMISKVFPAIAERYKALDNYEKSGLSKSKVDRDNVEQEMYRAATEKLNPTLANNLKYTRDDDYFRDPFFEDTMRDNLSRITGRSRESMPEPGWGTDGALGEYNPKTGELNLSRRYYQNNDQIGAAATYAHELNHKEYPNSNFNSERLPDFSKYKYPSVAAYENNNHHNRVVASNTSSEMKKLGLKDDSDINKIIGNLGQQYTVYDTLLNHLPEEARAPAQEKPTRLGQLKKLLGAED